MIKIIITLEQLQVLRAGLEDVNTRNRSNLFREEVADLIPKLRQIYDDEFRFRREDRAPKAKKATRA